MLKISKFSKLHKLFYFKNTNLEFYKFFSSLNNFYNPLHNVTNSEYWQQSVIPTNHFQRSLPPLPIPSLEDTCRRYLQALEPLMPSALFEETSRVVKDFSLHEGPDLQASLISYSKKLKNTSYIADIWFNMYWTDRRPLPLNFNPYLVFKKEPRSAYNDQAIRACNLIVSSVRIRRSLKENLLEPELFYGKAATPDDDTFKKIVRRVPEGLSTYLAYWYHIFPLNMSTHKHLFNTARTPKVDRDELLSESSGRHVVVVCRGQFYAFDVVKEDGNMLDPKIILENIRYVLNDSKEASLSSSAPSSPSSASSSSFSSSSSSPSHSQSAYPEVGYFTTMERNEWAGVREKLQLLGNRGNLDSIEKSILLLSLEHDDDNNDVIGDDDGQLAKVFLAGNAANRWFDKSVTLIVRRDGMAGVNFEHSWGDGVAMLRYFQDVYKDSTENSFVHPSPSSSSALSSSSSSSSSSSQPQSSRLVNKMRWKMTSELEATLARARSRYEGAADTAELVSFRHAGIDKHLLKRKKLSPDSFMQLAFQIAFDVLYGSNNSNKPPCLPTSYESCSTAAFKHGRTETLRPATMEVLQAIKLFRRLSDDNELIEAVRKCSAKHSVLTREASMGQGFDRHLLGLKAMADPSNLPTLFTHVSHHLINHNLLSTSTLSSPAIHLGGFAPTAQDALGIGYQITDTDLQAIICGNKMHRNLRDYTEALATSLQRLQGLLEKMEG